MAIVGVANYLSAFSSPCERMARAGVAAEIRLSEKRTHPRVAWAVGAVGEAIVGGNWVGMRGVLSIVNGAPGLFPFLVWAGGLWV